MGVRAAAADARGDDVSTSGVAYHDFEGVTVGRRRGPATDSAISAIKKTPMIRSLRNHGLPDARAATVARGPVIIDWWALGGAPARWQANRDGERHQGATRARPRSPRAVAGPNRLQPSKAPPLADRAFNALVRVDRAEKTRATRTRRQKPEAKNSSLASDFWFSGYWTRPCPRTGRVMICRPSRRIGARPVLVWGRGWGAAGVGVRHPDGRQARGVTG